MSMIKANILAATNDANMVAADAQSGKSGYVKGKKIVGTTDFAAIYNTTLGEYLTAKLAQSGVDSDTYAWSDSIEDTSGINIAASSEFSCPGQKLMADYFDVRYDANELPPDATPAWPDGGGTNDTVTQADGILTMVTTGDSGLAYFIINPDSTSDASKVKVLQFRFRITAWTTTNVAHGVRVSIVDGTRQAYIYLRKDGGISYLNSSTQIISMASGQDFSTFATWSVELDNSTGLKVFKNGIQVGSTIAYTSLKANAAKYFDFEQAGGLTTEWDYVYFSHDKATRSTATVIWTAHSASGDLTNAMVKATATLGTGSITYYMSRDGGSTFTECDVDTLTDISAQPAGTSVVCKAVIAGNAELLALAYGVRPF